MADARYTGQPCQCGNLDCAGCETVLQAEADAVEVELQNLDQFIEDHQITSHATRTSGNPNMADASPDARHWIVELRNATGDTLEVPFTMGSGLVEADGSPKVPTAADVLDCLASDSAGVENARSFEDWADEYGYDTDSRKAFATFEACERQAAELQAWLGDDAYQHLLWKVERQ